MKIILLSFILSLIIRVVLYSPVGIFDDNPTLLRFDSYYFAREAKEIAQGYWSNEDCLRNFPDCVYRQSPYLISLLHGYLSKFLSVSVEKINIALEHILASLFIIPCGLLFRRYGYTLEGAFGAFLASLAPTYFFRTLPGSMDTDSLNLFFSFLSAHLASKVADCKSQLKAQLLFALYLLSLYFYMLWYPKVELVALSLIGFIFGFILSKNKAILCKSTLLLMLLQAILLILAVHINIKYIYVTEPLSRAINYGSSKLSIFEIISETKEIPFWEAFGLITTSSYIFLIGIAGFLAFSIENPRIIAFMLPIVAVGVFFFISERVRFLMYVAPLYGIGVVFIIRHLYDLLHGRTVSTPIKKTLDIAKYASILSLVPYLHLYYVSKDINPSVSHTFAQKLTSLRDYVDEKGGIVSWWDYGYAIQYYAERATVVDGGNFLNVENVSKALLSTSESETVNHIRRIVRNTDSPVYILITADMLSKLNPIASMYGAKAEGIFLGGPVKKNCSTYMDENKGFAVVQCKNILVGFPLKSITYLDRSSKAFKHRKFKGDRNFHAFVIEYDGDKYIGIFSSSVKDSFIVRAFINPHIRWESLVLVRDEFPYYVLYKVVR